MSSTRGGRPWVVAKEATAWRMPAAYAALRPPSQSIDAWYSKMGTTGGGARRRHP